MKPVTVTTTIDRPREDVYAMLEDLMNHLRKQNGRALERLKEQLEAR